jgi:sigma-B regulation protein RsbU (phosphoserine phosphatase)
MSKSSRPTGAGESGVYGDAAPCSGRKRTVVASGNSREITMADQNSPGSDRQTFVGTFREDLRRGDFKQTVKREFDELKEFMLDEERLKRLTEMNRWRRGFHIAWWLLKSLFFKLTPARRILVIIGIVLLWSFRVQTDNPQISIDLTLPGGLVLLFVLMLELKDKLIARKELEAGRVVQKALLPERSPRIAGWNLWLFMRPANEVGGDLVDFVQVSESRFGIVVGDVAGKGLGAALLAARLQATLRVLVTELSSLDVLGAKLNEIFCRDCLPNVFASMIYFELQPDSGVIRAVNAGHIPPVIVKGAIVAKMEKGGPALGIMHEASFTEGRAQLEKEDLFLVYSDGLTEAQNEQGEFFGEQRLLDLLPKVSGLPADQIGENLVREVDLFIGEARAHDDLSIALLKRV